MGKERIGNLTQEKVDPIKKVIALILDINPEDFL